MSKTAVYHRQGWQKKEFQVVSADADAGTVDLADENGVVVVEGVQVINDHKTRDSLPSSFAVLVAAAKPKAKPSSKRREGV